MSRTFLLEIGSEEIPAGYLPPAAEGLKGLLKAGLAERRIGFSRVDVYAAPRRLIAIVGDLEDRQADLDKEVLGPPARVAWGADGALSKAGEGFARSQGVAASALRRVETPKGEYASATVHETGRPTAGVLLEWLPQVIGSIGFPRTMKWEGNGLRYARPIRWIVALLDDEVLPLAVGKIRAGRQTRGHRLFVSGPVEVPRAGDMLAVLEKAGVIADPAARAAKIRTEVAAAARAAGGRAVEDADLLEEVDYLVEYPKAVVGGFDRDFLALPREIIVTAMRSHQRYFAVEDESGRLLPNFITVANGRWDDPSQVVAGNERVLRARLADARFYWDADLKVGLAARLEELKRIVWLEGAGTLYDRTERIETLAVWLGGALRTSDDRPVVDDAGLAAARRGARLAKADLATDMIRDGKEFTTLQGIVGSEYARVAGEEDGVVRTIREHYAPRGPQDPLPGSVPGLLVALADRLDTLAGCFAMGLVPSGSQDPYALRRAANGIMRILLESGWHLSLRQAVTEAIRILPASAREVAAGGPGGVATGLLDFLRDRLDYFLRESGLPYDVTAAVLSAGTDDAVDARARGRALAAIRGEADLEKLVVGFKRAANILKGVEATLPPVSAELMSGAEKVESVLHDEIRTAGREVEAAMSTVDYPRAVRAFLRLRGPIDAFFEGVMVMSDDDRERRRRLALLSEVKALFDRLFDLSRIVVEG